MIDYTTIYNTLSLLDKEYVSSSGVDLPLLYSKLAVLEFSGWIEVSFDSLCSDYINNHIVNIDNQKRIGKIINHNYGFTYDQNVFPMMCSVLGINNWENILDAFPPTDLLNLKAVLSNYKTERDRAAHNNTVPGVTPAYLSPSLVIADYNRMKPAIQFMEMSIQAL